MLIFGILNIIYQATSLVPAFRSSVVAAQALGMQGDTARDGRQSLTYGFLQECGNRKAQNLPLGKDCVKYLTKTPKAPPDIDDWMEDDDKAMANSTTTRLRTRDMDFDFPVTHVDDDKVGMKAVQSPASFRMWMYFDLICIAIILVCIWQGKESRQYIQRMLQYSRSFIGYKMRQSGFHLGRVGRILMSPSNIATRRLRIIGFILYTLLFIFMVGRWIKEQWRWKVASEFIAQCKSRIENNELLGEDCTKYTSKKLKPQPEFKIYWWELFTFTLGPVFILVKLFTNTRIVLDFVQLTLETLGLRRRRHLEGIQGHEEMIILQATPSFLESRQGGA
ncbi:hypothetical protein ACEPPN_004144 [Leptodophora sp. 'Broadleaf-Isolate-01']